MRGFHHVTVLSPSFYGVRKERLAQWPPIYDPKMTKMPRRYFQKNWVGMCGKLPETLTLFQTKICDLPYPISDLIKKLIPYFRPETLEPGAWPERVTSCYGTYTVVGVNIKREMVLSPNDEEVANSSKKQTQFKTRVHKPYPISDQNGWKKHTLWRRTYPYGLYKGLPPGAKNTLLILSLAAYASETNDGLWVISCDLGAACVAEWSREWPVMNKNEAEPKWMREATRGN